MLLIPSHAENCLAMWTALEDWACWLHHLYQCSLAHCAHCACLFMTSMCAHIRTFATVCTYAAWSSHYDHARSIETMYTMCAANYYHSMGEAIPNFHIRSCLAFGHCNGSAEDGPTYVRYEWAHNLKNPSWPEVLPAVDQALKCMTNKETIHIEQRWPHNEVSGHAACSHNDVKG